MQFGNLDRIQSIPSVNPIGIHHSDFEVVLNEIASAALEIQKVYDLAAKIHESNRGVELKTFGSSFRFERLHENLNIFFNADVLNDLGHLMGNCLEVIASHEVDVELWRLALVVEISKMVKVQNEQDDALNFYLRRSLGKD